MNENKQKHEQRHKERNPTKKEGRKDVGEKNLNQDRRPSGKRPKCKQLISSCKQRIPPRWPSG